MDFTVKVPKVQLVVALNKEKAIGLLWEYREVPLTALASVSPCHCTQPRHIRHLSHHYPLNTLGRAAAGLLLPLSATNGCGDGNKYS